MNGKQLKNSILQWAIQGKLVQQDPNDEPASVLLEHIREEKAKLVKEKKSRKIRTNQSFTVVTIIPIMRRLLLQVRLSALMRRSRLRFQRDGNGNVGGISLSLFSTVIMHLH